MVEQIKIYLKIITYFKKYFEPDSAMTLLYIRSINPKCIVKGLQYGSSAV